MTLMIRQAVPDDLPEVHEMIGLLARHHDDEPKISLETLRRQVLDLRLGRVWVAADGGIHPYPAWQTALDGVLNRHYEEQPVGAWRGGLRLRQLLVEGPK